MASCAVAGNNVFVMPQRLLTIALIYIINNKVRPNMKMKILLYISFVAYAMFVYFTEIYGQGEVCSNLFAKSGTAGEATGTPLCRF
jgi:RAB protein geranylgeranyltransferase component A